MKKVLVTGGAGFIGSHLVDELINQNYQVVIIDNLSTGKKENLNPKAKFYNLDIRDSKISKVFEKEKPNVVFHLGAHISVKDSVVHPQECSDINILGSINLVENFLEVNEHN
jgi:UDP-glucose 4-epimerase